MRSLVVYESMFGMTRDVADAIAAVLASGGTARSVEVDAVREGDLASVDLLVVGGPTHAWGMSKSFTRRSAAVTADDRLVSRGRDLRRWLRQLPPGHGRAAAAFDTRLDESRFYAGSAARGIARALRRRGCVLIAPPASFRVESVVGPLVRGELDNARAWATMLLDVAPREQTVRPSASGGEGPRPGDPGVPQR